MTETNLVSVSGYGNDPYCESAKAKIREAIGIEDAEIYLLVGGTQTNQLAICTQLTDYEGVVCAATGHIATHEAGAIEYTGHKVLTVPEHDGKIDPAELEAFLRLFYADGNHEHMVFPGMVYISHPTELGTLYTKNELQELSRICRSYEIPLYLDGARLGYGLMSRQTDVTLKDIARYCDLFYIGGTKVGAYCGEALVYTKHNMPKHFTPQVKQHGALLAKGRLLGIQFDALFTDHLYEKISQNAIDRAEELKAIFRKYGYTFFKETPTNQQFLILENEEMKRLREKIVFSFWETVDDTHTAVRFVTSWATTPEMVQELEEVMKR